MTQASDMLAAYLAAETAILQGKDVSFGGRRQTMEDLPAIRAGRQEWERRVQSEAAQAAGARGQSGLGRYSVARFG